jgi:hypothetical protein
MKTKALIAFIIICGLFAYSNSLLACPRPTADLTATASPYYVCVGVPVNLDGGNSYSYPWYPIIQYKWDFHYNGTFHLERTTGTAITSYSYSQPGTYTVALKVVHTLNVESLITADSQCEVVVSKSGNAFFSGGGQHSLFIKSDGTVWGCGLRPGAGTAVSGSEPDRVLQGDKDYPVNDEYLEGIVFLDAGDSHSLAVDSDGNVWSWGMNDNGELGIGDPLGWGVVFYEPVKVKNTFDESGFLSGIVKVAGSREAPRFAYSLALDVSGFVWAWGSNRSSVCDDVHCARYGQLGIGSEVASIKTPQKVVCGETYLQNIVDIDAGVQHSIACDSDGHVWTWGYNGSGQLGNGSGGHWEQATAPVKVLRGGMATTSGYLENIVDVAVTCGDPLDYQGSSSYALDDSGHVWAWGAGWRGQLGDNNESRWFDDCDPYWHSYTPIEVKRGDMPTASGYLENIVAISAGRGHVLALDKFGYVWAWGVNDSGQVGNGGVGDCVYYPCIDDTCRSIENSGVMAPDKVQKSEEYCDGGGVCYLSDIVAIDAGKNYSMAIDRSGVVWVWGNNSYGQLGLGDSSYSDYPMAVQMDTWTFCPP